MDNFDFKAYIANNPLLKEEEEADINSSQLGSDMSTLANSLDDAIEDQLEKSEEEEGDINEALDPASLLSYILASNTVVNILSKQAMKIAKKYEWGKGEEAARNIYKFTHELEEKFKSPIRFIVSKFTKDSQKVKTITNSLFVLFLGYLAFHAGGSALKYLKQAKLSAGGIAGLKAALKGKDIVATTQDIINDLA
tara:strand:- start:47 stop:631 length:585 start_codon:yes stop_codon:yes gene_type:complete